ncbi:ATP-binding protein [Candidatus Woesearchaeota archaeon]|nr:ATP-binding protein [Candidatus Woesearchaeota archaeon]
MVQKDILRQVVTVQKKELLTKAKVVHRDILDEILKWFSDQRVIILTGVRRCGKSTLLKQIMQRKTGWCYINFEDERLIDFRAQDFEMLNEVLIEVYGPSKTYFFDEVQNIEKFETFVRRLQDQGKKVVITGSNASLLSKELGTRLTGRYKSFEVYPFSFREFLAFKQVTYSKDDFYISEKKVALLKLSEEYFSFGGLPEYLKNRDKDYVRTVYENILYRDIITRYSVRREKLIKELVNILATNATLKFTYNSLKKTLGLANAITAKEYISYLENSYLFFELLRFSHSIRQQLASPRKVYLVDSSFNQVCGVNFTPNKGRNMENAAYIELRRKGKEACYYANKNECDFVIKSGTRITEALQVCYALDETNKEREIAGLLEAMDTFKLKQGMILTFEQSEELTVSGKKIRVLPMAKWMLGTAL